MRRSIISHCQRVSQCRSLCKLFCILLYVCVCVFALCSFIFGVDASAATSMASMASTSASASTSTSAKNARNLTDIKLCGTWHTPGQSHCCKRHSHRTGHVVRGTRTCYMLHAVVHSGHAPRPTTPRLTSSRLAQPLRLSVKPNCFPLVAGVEPFDTKFIDLLFSISLIPSCHAHSNHAWPTKRRNSQSIFGPLVSYI